MKVNIQVQCTAKPLDQRYRASEGCSFRITGLLDQMRGDNGIDYPKHLARGAEIAGKPFVIRKKARRNSDKAAAAGKSKSVRITVSIGFADSTIGESSSWDVLKLADKALYRAKGKGRNCIRE